MPTGLESAQKKGNVFDFASKLQAGSDTNRSGTSQRSTFSSNSMSKSKKPLPPISMASVKPTEAVTKGLRRLKDDVLDNSLQILNALKLRAPGGTCSIDQFFDTLQNAGVHCKEEEVMHIVKNLTDQKSQVRYPLFFQTFAEMKDHHSADYADGYFHDGTFEQWKAQQVARAS